MVFKIMRSLNLVKCVQTLDWQFAFEFDSFLVAVVFVNSSVKCQLSLFKY